MTTTLLADSGSTKTDWALVGKDGSTTLFTTSGLNPVVLGEEKVKDILVRELMPHIDNPDEVGTIGFFGAGCTPAKILAVKDIFRSMFHHLTTLTVDSDMLGAAIAACGHEKGIAAILGTGSNSCLYDGRQIIQHTPCLGYILGDEGGGAVLGKHFLNSILKGTLPEKLCRQFFEESQLTSDIIINKVYRGEAPNRFLASMSPFILRHIDEPELHNLVVKSFRQFFRNNIRQYGHPEMPVHFVGSMGYYYAAELREAAQKEGFRVGKIIKSPIEGLIEKTLSAT